MAKCDPFGLQRRRTLIATSRCTLTCNSRHGVKARNGRDCSADTNSGVSLTFPAENEITIFAGCVIEAEEHSLRLIGRRAVVPPACRCVPPQRAGMQARAISGAPHHPTKTAASRLRYARYFCRYPLSSGLLEVYPLARRRSLISVTKSGAVGPPRARARTPPPSPPAVKATQAFPVPATLN